MSPMGANLTDEDLRVLGDSYDASLWPCHRCEKLVSVERWWCETCTAEIEKEAVIP